MNSAATGLAPASGHSPLISDFSPASLYNPLMPDPFDIAAQLLHVSGGRLSPDEPPGFATITPPRKAARGREKDTLILCLSLKAREALPAESYDALMELAAATFFGSPGSVTAALRQALAAVNQKLLDDNLAGGQATGGAPAQAGLLGAALRGADFYAVQSGPGLLLVGRPTGHERFPQTVTRALGQSNTLEASYFHTTVSAGDYLCFSNVPARGWTDIALVGLGNLAGLPEVVERLRESAGTDAAALIIRLEAAAIPAAPGIPIAPAESPAPSTPPARRSGPAAAPRQSPAPRSRAAGLAEFFRLKPRRAPAPEPAPADAGVDANGGIPVTVEAGAAPEVFWGAPHPPSQPAAPAEPEPLPNLPDFLAERAPASAPQPSAAPRQRASAPSAETSTPPHAPTPSRASPFQRLFRGLGRSIGVTIAEAIRGLRVLIARTLPEGAMQREGMFVVPTSVQIGIALLIPVVIVGVSVWLYLENGRDEQYAAALTEAQWAVARGRAAGDVEAARPHWEAAIEWLAQAEALRPNQAEVSILRQEAQGYLDELDWVTRLDFQPLLLAGLGSGTRLTHLVLVGQDVYLLDQGHNRVLRLTPNAASQTTAGGYTLDSTYQCAGGQTLRDITVGDLIDIALVPGPTVIAGDTTLSGDVVVALDSLGALLYCTPGLAQPYASYLAAPEIGWVRPTAVELYADRLYVLDPGTSNIWQYQASGGAFTSAPDRYFTSVAYDFGDAIEFAIAGGDIFILRRDGRAAHCTRAQAGAAPTCAAAAQYIDSRPGRAVGDRLAGVSRPMALAYDAPPEPSLYLLDGDTSALYQLSLKLVLVRQYRPYFPLAGPITAAGLDPAKRFFVAAGDNVYVATRP